MSGSLPCFSHISASRDVGPLRITLLIFLCRSINTLIPSNLMTLSVAGSSATAKRTQRDGEDCIELRKILTVEAEALQTAAGNMCGTVLRGTVAPPESESPFYQNVLKIRSVEQHWLE